MNWIFKRESFMIKSKTERGYEKQLQTYARPKDSEIFEFSFPPNSNQTNEKKKEDSHRIVHFICPFVKKNSFTPTKVKIDFSPKKLQNFAPKNNQGTLKMNLLTKVQKLFDGNLIQQQKAIANLRRFRKINRENFKNKFPNLVRSEGFDHIFMIGNPHFRKFIPQKRTWANMRRKSKTIFELMFKIPKNQVFVLESNIRLSHIVFETSRNGNINKMIQMSKQPSKIKFQMLKPTNKEIFISMFVINPMFNLLDLIDFKFKSPRDVILKVAYFKKEIPGISDDLNLGTNENFDFPKPPIPDFPENPNETKKPLFGTHNHNLNDIDFPNDNRKDHLHNSSDKNLFWIEGNHF